MSKLTVPDLRRRLIRQGVDPQVAAQMVSELNDPDAMSERLGSPVGAMSITDYFAALGYSLRR